MLVTLQVRRGRPGEKWRWQSYKVELPSDAYALDAMEAARMQDSTLAYRHACHHASCGSCAVRINGRERLPCVTRLDEIGGGCAPIRLEPLRNFPLVADLVVDRDGFLARMRSSGMACLRIIEEDDGPADVDPAERFEDCIECGICLSACPIAGTDSEYLGPAALAAAERAIAEPRGTKPAEIAAWVDTRHGVWRCHGVFECSAACPMQVDPAAAIMRLRRAAIIGGGQ